MATAEFIIALFYRIDNQMPPVPKHPQAALYPSEVVTLTFCMRSKAAANAPSIAGFAAIGRLSSLDGRSAPGYFACLPPTRIGRMPSGRSLRRWGSLTAMASS